MTGHLKQLVQLSVLKFHTLWHSNFLTSIKLLVVSFFFNFKKLISIATIKNRNLSQIHAFNFQFLAIKYDQIRNMIDGEFS